MKHSNTILIGDTALNIKNNVNINYVLSQA
ncbi:uncharacterized protein METZ01_LOCUS141257 [marine metagenome]|uniref:Uncharacterized protein n=1 Tax=marine metagenome TaxID=408172 RepID=A0A381ZI32_9ZZZZ